MPDMLVSLLDLPDERPLCDALFAQGIELVRPLPPDKHRVLAWMQQNAYPSAASECEVCFFRQRHLLDDLFNIHSIMPSFRLRAVHGPLIFLPKV